jgi:membrane fusion protein
VAALFLATASYTKKETVVGVLQPNKGLVKLFSDRDGIVQLLHVSEGQKVKTGQPILTIISERFSSDGLELNNTVIEQYQLQISRISKQINDEQKNHTLTLANLEQRRLDYSNRLTNLDRKISIILQRSELNSEITKNTRKLVSKGYAPEHKLAEQKDVQLSIQQQLIAAKSEKLSISQQLASTNIQIEQEPLSLAKQLNNLNKNRSDLQISLAQLNQSAISEVRSPTDGIVSLSLIKEGQTVTKRQNLLDITPEQSELQAVLYAPTSAFGFIDNGQEVKLRYKAFPFERYGSYLGQVSQISKDVILPSDTAIKGLIQSPSYRIVVTLKKQMIDAYGKKLSLRSGMMVDADIITEKRSLIRWLFDPVYSIKGRL